jgi:hypothetical protein
MYGILQLKIHLQLRADGGRSPLKVLGEPIKVGFDTGNHDFEVCRGGGEPSFVLFGM